MFVNVFYLKSIFKIYKDLQDLLFPGAQKVNKVMILS